MSINRTGLALAAVLMFSPAAAMAEEFPLQVSVEAFVPSPNGLQVSPVGDWAGITQNMFWDIATQKLKPIQQQVDLKSGLGAINAYLTADANLTSAANTIKMTVSVAGKPLALGSAAAVEVATANEAANSKRAAVEIVAAAAPNTGYAQGNYQGNVFMMFESAAPTTP
ncbi:CS1 type fimbrial major subunit [Stenotrophomonas rhizophila]|uniref:CS1 type fimbrial major subunit n=1 Tax=Stenotrophomonas rhizophila TaxID=216778 RepID=UPI001E3EAEBF|nr:CS1 type fimbrial major subunit [Stenotrophomonas rhizophila]MCC7634820.1 adhesin [Stenotrophomonas rhizophila]MCC7664507.1 adhesin [Stenotrophomonas rhizophila]